MLAQGLPVLLSKMLLTSFSSFASALSGSALSQHFTLAELGKGCINSGYLAKLASVGTIWKRRYFVLKDRQLLYFNSAAVRPHPRWFFIQNAYLRL